MEYPKKEIIKEITDLFGDYEETYVPGEWEAFSRRKKKKYPFFTQWVSVAAVVLLVSSVVFFNLKKDAVKKKDTVQINKIKPAVPENTPVPAVSHRSWPAVTGMAAAVRQYVPRPVVKDTAETVIGQHVPAVLKGEGTERFALSGRDTAGHGDEADQLMVAAAGISVPQKETLVKKGKLSMMDFLAMESKAADQALKKKVTRSKWDFGVQIMPATTGSNVDFGGGITTAYRLSDRFSLSSGISLLQVQAGKDVSPPAGQVSYALASISVVSAASPEKKLTAVNANIKALDIPVSLIYRVNKHFYTSAGLSLFNVLSEKRSNTYLQTSQVDRMAVNPETGFVSSYKTLQTTEVMESFSAGTSTIDGDPVKENNSVGFFNFSIGRQQNIFNKYSIQIEPFIKVPLGKFSSENLNLLNSGIKFQLSF